MDRRSGITIALAILIGGVGQNGAQAASDIEAVKGANQSYYAVLSARDIHAIEKVWSQSPDDVNVAPPVRPVANVGWATIKKNYGTFWSTLDELTVSMEIPRSRSKEMSLGSMARNKQSDELKMGRLPLVLISARAFS
jgi:hypothetical protein